MREFDYIAEQEFCPTNKMILDVVAALTGISVARMLSDCRKNETTKARDLAIHRIRSMTRRGSKSLPYIGRIFNRDHTTILAALRRQDERFKNDKMDTQWDVLCINYTRRNYRDMTARDIAFNIGRTENSVQKKIEKLRLDENKFIESMPEPKLPIVRKYKGKPKKKSLLIISQQMQTAQYDVYSSPKKLKTKYATNMAQHRQAKRNGHFRKADEYLHAARLAAQELGKITHGRVIL